MNRSRRTYKNAGAQTVQGRIEARTYWDAPDSDLFTIKGISLVLGINRNAVKQIPIQRIMIDKRGYYRKGDVLAWMEVDLQQEDSLLRKLQGAQDKATERKYKQPSRHYVSGQPSKKAPLEATLQDARSQAKTSEGVSAWRIPSSFNRPLGKKK